MAQIRRREGSFELGGLARLNRMLDEAFGGWSGLGFESGGALTSAWLPPCDVMEDARTLRLQMELPGVKPDDIKLSIENNLLSIRGEKRQQSEDQNERIHRYERSFGSFERTFSLPSTVDPEKINADFEDGILTVTIPKAERARPREIRVGGGGGRTAIGGRGAGEATGPSRGGEGRPMDRDPEEEGSAGKRPAP